MAKIKSVKFYNFKILKGIVTFNANFYDDEKNLIIMDFSNRLKTSDTYCETLKYIVTSSRSHIFEDRHHNFQAFHTGNCNKEVGLQQLGCCWVPINGSEISINDFIKIEFKTPTKLSDIKVLHSYVQGNGFNICDYDIEYENYKIKSYQYVSNGELSPFTWDECLGGAYDQNTMNSLFESIEFDKSTYIYDSKIGYVETLDTNNFRNIPINKFEKLKALCIKPANTYLNCLISFDQKSTWKMFNGISWSTVSDTSIENIILNGMELGEINKLNKSNLIAGGFTGDLDFKIAMKTNDANKTPSISKIYIKYK